MLYIHLYESVLPLFKSFILTFEQDEPMMHKLHEKLIDATRCFLTCFLKPEVIAVDSPKKLHALDVSLQANG